MKLFHLVVRQNVDGLVNFLDKNKHDIICHILENLLSLLSHLYKKTVDENHSIKSTHLSIVSLIATMIIVRYFQSSEKSAKNTVLLKK